MCVCQISFSERKEKMEQKKSRKKEEGEKNLFQDIEL
jgi:uncharacterized protein YkuJ